MHSSDPFDDDDLFDNPDVLLAVEAAEQSLGKPPARYHHNVAAPRSVAPFGRRKDGTPRDPAPLNVAPGSVAGGFGWEHGGKRVAEGNVARHVEAVNKRQIRDEEPIDFMIDSTGNYAQPDAVGRPPQLPSSQSAEARRQAIAGAPSAFSRSVSANALPLRQPAHRPALEPIASQSSQGGAVRKLHLDLEAERERREALEQELASLRQGPNAELQNRVYEAEGKAATLERNKLKVSFRLDGLTLGYLALCNRSGQAQIQH